MRANTIKQICDTNNITIITGSIIEYKTEIALAKNNDIKFLLIEIVDILSTYVNKLKDIKILENEIKTLKESAGIFKFLFKGKIKKMTRKMELMIINL